MQQLRDRSVQYKAIKHSVTACVSMGEQLCDRLQKSGTLHVAIMARVLTQYMPEDS